MALAQVDGHSCIVDAVKAVLRGESIETREFLSTLSKATLSREGKGFFEEVSGETVVIGPCRGHAVDLAYCLERYVLARFPNGGVNIVFLGNYVDGGHNSVEVLYMIALAMLSLPCVIPLVGRHEMLYPHHPGGFGSLRRELFLRSLRCGIPMEDMEDIVRCFFSKLPVACTVNKRFFCSSSGLASCYRFVEEIARERFQWRLGEFVQNQPMNEEEDKSNEGYAFVGSHTAAGNCLRYTHNALCNFLLRNNLFTHIGGIEYHALSERSENFMELDRRRESKYLPGWVFGRMRTEPRAPSYIFLFSASHFCDVNRNSGCILTISKSNAMVLQQFDVHAMRPAVMPCEQNHAFAWSYRLLMESVVDIFYNILRSGVAASGRKCPDDKSSFHVEVIRNEDVMKWKYRRMCEMVKSLLLRHQVEKIL
uniref:Serine/threonine specific protein phosphatases domain-containing protein n=1 Tax=Trypanosoma congolense (strain IL3000) TaxID=1068625 RepID=G0UN87_TRYCI|nr:conserved hypothetical protein [Trypanosoma congolense IL3000]